MNAPKSAGEDVTATTGQIEMQLLTGFATLTAEVRGLTGLVSGMDPRLRNVENDVATLKARPSSAGPDPLQAAEIAALKAQLTAEVKRNDALALAISARALSWPKVGALVAGIGSILVVATYIDSWTPGT